MAHARIDFLISCQPIIDKAHDVMERAPEHTYGYVHAHSRVAGGAAEKARDNIGQDMMPLW